QYLQHDRLVRQLIGVAAMLRKMRRERSRRRRDSLDRAGFEISRTKVSLHRGADLLPTLHPTLGVDAAIGDDLDLAVGEQEIDQHAVVVMGVPDAPPPPKLPPPPEKPPPELEPLLHPPPSPDQTPPYLSGMTKMKAKMKPMAARRSASTSDAPPVHARTPEKPPMAADTSNRPNEARDMPQQKTKPAKTKGAKLR